MQKIKTNKKDIRDKLLKIIDDYKNDFPDDIRDLIMRLRAQIEISLKD